MYAYNETASLFCRNLQDLLWKFSDNRQTKQLLSCETDVATIVGTQSYGKGIVQSVIDLRDGTALKITTAKYYTPNGNNIHGIGITPDVEIDLPEELKTQIDISYEEDVQLQKAIEVLQQ